MAVWKKINSSADLPHDRPVFLRGSVPWGARLPDEHETIHVGQRGNARAGLWVGAEFYPDDPRKGEIGSRVFTYFSEIPPFDGEA